MHRNKVVELLLVYDDDFMVKIDSVFLPQCRLHAELTMVAAVVQQVLAENLLEYGTKFIQDCHPALLWKFEISEGF